MRDAKDSVHRKTRKQQQNKQKKNQRQRENIPDKKKKKSNKESAEGLQQIWRPSVHAPRKLTELLHIQQHFLTYCQHDSSWIVKAIPVAMVKQHLKPKAQPDAGDVLI